METEAKADKAAALPKQTSGYFAIRTMPLNALSPSELQSVLPRPPKQHALDGKTGRSATQDDPFGKPRLGLAYRNARNVALFYHAHSVA